MVDNDFMKAAQERSQSKTGYQDYGRSDEGDEIEDREDEEYIGTMKDNVRETK